MSISNIDTDSLFLWCINGRDNHNIYPSVSASKVPKRTNLVSLENELAKESNYIIAFFQIDVNYKFINS